MFRRTYFPHPRLASRKDRCPRNLYRTDDKQQDDILDKPAEITDAGKLQAIVDEPGFSLEEVDQAHVRASGQAMGKVAVSV